MYIPPYLNEGRTPPSFTIAEKDWSYGGTYDIQVTLHHGTTANMRISLIAGTSCVSSIGFERLKSDMLLCSDIEHGLSSFIHSRIYVADIGFPFPVPSHL